MKKLLFYSLLLLILSACSDKKGKELFTGELQPVTLGLMPSTDGLPFIIAQKQGIYDSLGIDVKFVNFSSPTDRNVALQSGKLDGTITDYTSAALQQAHGTPIAVIMQTDGYLCLIANKENPVKELSQLRHQDIAISPSTVIEYATSHALDKTGLSPGEVNLPEINDIPLRLAMLENNQITASFFPDPYATMAMNNGHKSLTSTLELGISINGAAFTTQALTEKREEIERLITGYNLGVEYIRTHPQEEWNALLTEEFGIPEALTGLIALPAYQQAARPAKTDIHRAVSWLKALKRIPPDYNEENLTDSTFIPPKGAQTDNKNGGSH